ncbi:hypothetical protein ACOMHN_036959 [Nucella lapillus]
MTRGACHHLNSTQWVKAVLISTRIPLHTSTQGDTGIPLHTSSRATRDFPFQMSTQGDTGIPLHTSTQGDTRSTQTDRVTNDEANRASGGGGFSPGTRAGADHPRSDGRQGSQSSDAGLSLTGLSSQGSGEM